MKLKILATARHRNGVAGAPFDVVLFKVLRERGAKVGIVFDEPANCAVLDVSLLAAGDIAFGLNSWRGDEYEPELRRAVEYGREKGREADMTDRATIPYRVEKCDAVLRCYSGDVVSGLTDLLADARHWCDAAGEDFAEQDRQAYRHYLAEINEAKETKQ
jgi:hypothetical protein